MHHTAGFWAVLCNIDPIQCLNWAFYKQQPLWGIPCFTNGRE